MTQNQFVTHEAICDVRTLSRWQKQPCHQHQDRWVRCTETMTYLDLSTPPHYSQSGLRKKFLCFRLPSVP